MLSSVIYRLLLEGYWGELAPLDPHALARKRLFWYAVVGHLTGQLLCAVATGLSRANPTGWLYVLTLACVGLGVVALASPLIASIVAHEKYRVQKFVDSEVDTSNFALAPSEATIKIPNGRMQGRVIVSTMLVWLLMIAFLHGTLVPSKPLKAQQERGIILLTGAVLGAMGLIDARRLRRNPFTFEATANEQGVTIRVPEEGPISYIWTQFASVNQVEEFDEFGRSQWRNLVFRDADGAKIDSIPISRFKKEDADRFMSVVTRYFPTPSGA